jgi:hypothetical protein
MIYLLFSVGSPGSQRRGASTAIRRSPGVGYCTLGRAWTPTAWAAEGRRRTLQAIHAPLINSSTAPAGTVGGVLAGPIVAAYTRLKYMIAGAAAHSAPAHLGSVLERQTATPRRMSSSADASAPVYTWREALYLRMHEGSHLHHPYY